MQSSISKLVDKTTAQIEGKKSGAKTEAILAKIRSTRKAFVKAIAKLEVESGEQDIYIQALLRDIDNEQKKLKK